MSEIQSTPHVQKSESTGPGEKSRNQNRMRCSAAAPAWENNGARPSGSEEELILIV